MLLGLEIPARQLEIGANLLVFLVCVFMVLETFLNLNIYSMESAAVLSSRTSIRLQTETLKLQRCSTVKAHEINNSHQSHRRQPPYRQ